MDNNRHQHPNSNNSQISAVVEISERRRVRSFHSDGQTKNGHCASLPFQQNNCFPSFSSAPIVQIHTLLFLPTPKPPIEPLKTFIFTNFYKAPIADTSPRTKSAT
ncbi:hypothetical protein Droror1_Dr00006215 [Drosera rotundifolia]